MMGKLLISLAIPLLFGHAFFLQTKPNALFIMTDQQSYNMMSFPGNKWPKTPNSEYGFTLRGNIPYDGAAIYAEKVFAEIGKNPNVNTSLPKTMMAFKSMMEGTN